MWGKQYKETFASLAAEKREAAEAWVNHWKETQGYITKRDQEFADYRKRLDPIYESVQPYEQYWRMQGMDPVQGVRQVLSYAEAIARDPASMIPKLAEMYGVDLPSLIQQQPYVDPEVGALKRQIQQLQAAQHQQVQSQDAQSETFGMRDHIQPFLPGSIVIQGVVGREIQGRFFLIKFNENDLKPDPPRNEPGSKFTGKVNTET